MYTVTEAHYDWIVLKPDRTLLCNCGSVRDADAESDARRIARALNMEAAMGEVRASLMGCGSALTDILNAAGNGEPYSAEELLEDENLFLYEASRADEALAALDAAGKGE